METKDIILELRTKKGLSQEELAEKVFVTRQAVSRWENGETVPNTETLKLLSKLFNVSINTLLGSPRELICQCWGMPLEDSNVSREKDGTFNEHYCDGATPTAILPWTFGSSISTSAARKSLRNSRSSLSTNSTLCFILRDCPRSKALTCYPVRLSIWNTRSPTDKRSNSSTTTQPTSAVSWNVNSSVTVASASSPIWTSS